MIPGVKVAALKEFRNEQGAVQHFLRADYAEFFVGFGEVYFSLSYPGVIKGWHRHQQQTSVLSCVQGQLLLVLWQDGQLQEVRFADGQRQRVLIPPGVAYGWKNVGEGTSILANCATQVHDPSHSEKLPLDQIDYAWPDL